MLLLILKIALLTFIVCGAVAIVTVYAIRRPKIHYRDLIDVDPLLPDTRGVPPTPLPAWAHWDELNSEDPDEAPSARR